MLLAEECRGKKADQDSVVRSLSFSLHVERCLTEKAGQELELSQTDADTRGGKRMKGKINLSLIKLEPERRGLVPIYQGLWSSCNHVIGHTGQFHWPTFLRCPVWKKVFAD